MLQHLQAGWLTQEFSPVLGGEAAEAALQALHKFPVAQRCGAQVPHRSVPWPLAAARPQPCGLEGQLGTQKLLLLLLLRPKT